MHTDICDRLGIEFPIFAFSHCADIVAAVSRTGGFGVLGCGGFTPDQLAVELDRIDQDVAGRPYGIDIVIANNDAGRDETDPAALHAQLLAQVPSEHFEFANKILADHGVPELPPEEFHNAKIVRSTSTTARLHVKEAMRHEGVRLVANALGAPPVDLVEEIHNAGRLIAGLSGSVEHARKHVAAGVDVVIACGGEAGGHTGHISSIVLWPQVIAAVDPIPVLAGGGIGNGAQIASALALGAQGVWTGSLWLATDLSEMTVAQRELLIEARSEDAVISRSLTGKRNRLLRTAWTEAWERPDSPGMLPLPLQRLAVGEAETRINRYPKQSKDVSIVPVGQVVGQFKGIRKTTDTIQILADEYLEAVDRLNKLNAAALNQPS